MTLAQGAFLCLIFVFPIIGAVVVEMQSIDRVIARLHDLPHDKYMDFHETDGRGKEPLVEYVAKIGALNLSAVPGRAPRGAFVADGGSCAAAATSGRRSLLTARLRCANRNSSAPTEVSRSWRALSLGTLEFALRLIYRLIRSHTVAAAVLEER